jgi:hypothetical protein
MPNNAIPIGCLEGGRVTSIFVKAIGIKIPPVAPFRARKTIMDDKSQADAQQIEKNINKAALTKM